MALPHNLHPELRSLGHDRRSMPPLDHDGRHYNAPLHVLLGGAHAPPSSPAGRFPAWSKRLKKSKYKAREEFAAFKLKVGDEPHLDRERVRICRRIAGPEAYIKVDASGQWERKSRRADTLRSLPLAQMQWKRPLRAAARALAKDAPETVNERAESVAEALARVRRRAHRAYRAHGVGL